MNQTIASTATSSPASTALFERQTNSLAAGAETLAADVITPTRSTSPIQTLFLHGAGQSTRQRQWALRETLATLGHASAALDFSGHGDSSAAAPNSLHKRLEEAQIALDTMTVPARTVVGVSMSGEIAMRLACRPQNHIEHIVTIVGAVYDGAAFHLPFGPEFSAALRRPNSWRDAESLKLIANFTGRITLIRALDDQVIPHDIAPLIAEHAKSARHCRIIDLPGVDHRVSERCAQDEQLRYLIAQAIAECEC